MRLATFITLASVAILGSTQDTGPCDYKIMAQKIDHFGEHNGTFQQRYSFFDEFYEPGGPILFFQGEEGNCDCANTTVMYHYAKKLGGLAVSLEHRYFGESLPFGANESWTVPKLQYLTLDNIMADAVAFVEMLQSTVVGAANSKTIIASGSYGAFLVVVLRQNHPETFFGGIAAAAPVIGFGNDTDPDRFNWWNYVQNTYLEQSKEASVKIKQAFTVLRQRLLAGDQSLKSDLRLCDEPTPETSSLLHKFMAYPWSIAPEFNYAKARPGRGAGLVMPLNKVIDVALKAKTPLAVINDANWLFYGSYGDDLPPCISLEQEFLYKYFADGIQPAPFMYIVCTFMPANADNIPENNIFAGLSGPSIIEEDFCKERYNQHPISEKELKTRYHLTEEEIKRSTRIIFSEGQFDPVTAIGPAYLPISNDPCASKYLYVSDMAHREDLFFPDRSDKPTVVEARKIELETIKVWMEFCVGDDGQSGYLADSNQPEL